MPHEHSEISAYLRHSDTSTLLNKIAELFAAEGMVRVEKSSKRLHGAPALQNNRWAVHVMVGQGGWHLIRATPWSLLCDRAESASDSRFIELSKSLSGAGFLLCVMDFYPQAYGEVLVETDGAGRSLASGNWLDREWPEDGTDLDASNFFGTKLTSGVMKPQSQALKTLWQESRDIWNGPDVDQYDDCCGNSDQEIFCHYVARRLMGRSAWDVSDTDDWPADVKHTIYFEWPANDRPEPPELEPLPEPEVYYPECELVQVGDAVLLDDGLRSGHVTTFLYSGRSVTMVVVDTGGPGQQAVHIDGTAHGLFLVERNTSDYKKAAASFLAERATAGEIRWAFAYGVRHIQGIDVPQDSKMAYDWLKKAADSGHADAQCLVGMMSKDDEKAANYYRKSAEQGNVRAQFSLGLAYQKGTGVPQDLGQASHWYTLAMKQGNMTAHYNLGHFWIHSFKHATDPDTNFEWFKTEAEAGDAPAQWVAGLCVEYGVCGAYRNPHEAARFYEMGATKGFGPALCNLADKYENGKGLPQDLDRALKLYLQAAEKQVSAAYFSLGNMYKDGRGVSQDMNEAARWLSKAADAGWEEAKKILCEMPSGAYQQARRLLEQIRSGEAPLNAEEIYQKATEFYDPKDNESLALAYELHQQAAQRGHPHAIFQLGFMTLRGFATERNVDRAIELFKHSAQLGDMYAPAMLGELYEEGVDVPQDLAESKRWYEKAAECGSMEARLKLGQRKSTTVTWEEMGISVVPPESDSPDDDPPDRPWWKF